MPRTYKCKRCGGQGHGQAHCFRLFDSDGTYVRARPLLGTLSDNKVAAIVGASVQTISSWRRRLGIRNVPRQFDPETKYPGIVARLPLENNATLAMAYGISRERVRQIRKQLGIGGRKTATLPPEWVSRLGLDPDTHIARDSGVPVAVVRRARLAADIPAARVEGFYERVIGQVHDRVGRVSDRSLAAEIGVPALQIAAYRRRHGIQPRKMSPMCRDFVPVDREAVARMFHDGSTDDEIADGVGTTVAYIRLIRSQMKLVRCQPRRVPPHLVDEIRRRVAAGEVRWRIAEELGVNRSTVYRIAMRSDEK